MPADPVYLLTPGDLLWIRLWRRGCLSANITFVRGDGSAALLGAYFV